MFLAKKRKEEIKVIWVTEISNKLFKLESKSEYKIELSGESFPDERSGLVYLFLSKRLVMNHFFK